MDHTNGKTSFTGAELLQLTEKHTLHYNDGGVMYVDWEAVAKELNGMVLSRGLKKALKRAQVQRTKAR